MKYLVVLLPSVASESPKALANWLNGRSLQGLELVAVDGRNYIFKEVPIYTK